MTTIMVGDKVVASTRLSYGGHAIIGRYVHTTNLFVSSIHLLYIIIIYYVTLQSCALRGRRDVYLNIIEFSDL